MFRVECKVYLWKIPISLLFDTEMSKYKTPDHRRSRATALSDRMRAKVFCIEERIFCYTWNRSLNHTSCPTHTRTSAGSYRPVITGRFRTKGTRRPYDRGNKEGDDGGWLAAEAKPIIIDLTHRCINYWYWSNELRKVAVSGVNCLYLGSRCKYTVFIFNIIVVW